MNPIRLVGALFATLCAAAHAAYPDAPIRLVVSTSPGGATDITARLLAPRLSERLGQPVVVENKPGASGMIAGAFVAKQPANGYTLLIDNTTFAVNPAVQSQMTYDPIKVLAPVTQVIQSVIVLVVSPTLPAKSLGEFVALAKSKQGGLRFASAGTGSVQHLAIELFKRQTGADVIHVPYKGGGPALSDTVAGHADAYFGSLLSSIPHVRGDRLRALGVTGGARDKALPDVPTFAEAGIAQFVIYDWNGIFAPAGTPAAIVTKLQQEIAAVLSHPDVGTRLSEMGNQPVGNTPDEFSRFINREVQQWKRIAERSNISIAPQ